MTAPFQTDNGPDGTAGSQAAISSSYKTLIAAFATSTRNTRRFKIFDMMFGTNGTPADNELEFNVSIMTAIGTWTAGTAHPLDPADAAACTAVAGNASVEPTVTASTGMFYLGLNQRASYRWVAAPGSELVFAATVANGGVLRAKSTGYTGTATGSIYFYE